LNNDIKKIREERRWYERARLILEYHNLQCRNFGENKRHNKWKVSDTANNLDMSVGAVSEAIALAKSFNSHPELKLKTREEALTILKKFKNGVDDSCQN
jgi:hypothetical protein